MHCFMLLRHFVNDTILPCVAFMYVDESGASVVVRVDAVRVVGIVVVYMKPHESRAVLFVFMPCALCMFRAA